MRVTGVNLATGSEVSSLDELEWVGIAMVGGCSRVTPARDYLRGICNNVGANRPGGRPVRFEGARLQTPVPTLNRILTGCH